MDNYCQNMSAARSKLQTLYLQAQHWLPASKRAYPQFDTNRVTENSNSFLSLCTLQLTPPPAPVTIFHSSLASSKKKAEKDAAIKALDWFEKNTNQDTKVLATNVAESSSIKYKKVILVDVDNIQIPLAIVKKNLDTLFVMFVSRNGSTAHHAHANQLNCRIIITPMIGKDACDVHICYLAHRLQTEFENCLFAIASRDHFANILVGLMSNDQVIKSRKTWHLCNLNELDNFTNSS